MIFVLLYLIVSLFIYAKMFHFILNQDKGLRIRQMHPEMKEVRPDDPLLVVNFDGPSRSLSTDKSPDLGFSRFLADRDADDRDHDNS